MGFYISSVIISIFSFVTCIIVLKKNKSDATEKETPFIEKYEKQVNDKVNETDEADPPPYVEVVK